jgi:SAM-dependent methyltransferase
VRRFSRLLAPGAAVLDLACGSGRHSRYLQSAGMQVLAVDRDLAALQELALEDVGTLQVDLEAGLPQDCWPFAAHSFDAIVVTNYLHRPLFPLILSALRENGLLIYETFAAGNGAFGRPSRPEFLLADGELLQQMQSNPEVQMQVLAFEQGFVAQPKPAMLQRICARRASAVGSSDHL